MLAPLSVELEYGGGASVRPWCGRVAGGAETRLQSCSPVRCPAYYMRFGFSPSCLYGIGHENIPEQYLRVVELVPDALDGGTGMVRMG